MIASAAVEVSGVSHRYGDRQALDAVSLHIEPGEVFAFLGPNGGGKTTLFRLLSTLIPLQSGSIAVFGRDVMREADAARRAMGVVFQAPSLDKKLTVAENLHCQGALYGMSGVALSDKRTEMLARLGLAERARDRVETLSGGLRRRVELAKGMLHSPRILLLDEPSTGLDPGARTDLWSYLRNVQKEQGVTIVLTTHLLEEAERADRIAILNEGKIVALDSPDRLRAEVGGDSILIQTPSPDALSADIRERFSVAAQVVGGAVRFESAEGAGWVAKLLDAFGERIQSVTVGKPTLDDVFIARTGRRFWNASGEGTDG